MGAKEDKLGELKEEQNQLEEYKMSIGEQEQVLKDQAAVIENAKKEAKSKLNQLSKENNSSSNESNSNFSGGGSGTFIKPVNGRYSSGYGPRPAPYGDHLGVDFAAPIGTTIKAGASGVVTRSAYSSSYGNVVYVYHPKLNKSTVYAHMSARSVSLGQSVSTGQKLGAVGNTGDSYGAHLHFEVHNGKWSHKGGINPMPFLP